MSEDVLKKWATLIAATAGWVSEHDEADAKSDCIQELAAALRAERKRVVARDDMSNWEYLKSLPGVYTWPEVIEILVRRHGDRGTWQSLPRLVWLGRLMAEIAELVAAVADDHEHSWEFEAAQIASICINMLRWHGLPMAALEAAREEEP